MTFNFSRMTLVSVSVLSLSVLSGCSNTGDTLKAYSQNATQPSINRVDPYDSYYGKVTKNNQGNTYSPKIVRTVTKPVFKHNAPQRYVVKKGDTLWGISHKFLNNPAYWPEIWDKNQKVRNPHRIYPEDVLYIYHGKRNIKLSNGSIVEKMVPQLRIERNGDGEPISTLSAFLVWPRVLDQETINKAPYIAGARLANLLIEKDETVYIKNLKDRHAGGRYAIFNTGKVISDPDTGKKFGNEVIYTGFLEVEHPALGQEVATATVAESIREIHPGDRLLYIKDETHSLKAPIQIPNRKIRGTVISMFDAELVAGQTQVITINKGARNGIKPGFTLGVYSPGKTIDDPVVRSQKHFWGPVVAAQIDLPPTRAATAIVYKVLNDISYALISNSTHEVKNGFKIGNP